MTTDLNPNNEPSPFTKPSLAKLSRTITFLPRLDEDSFLTRASDDELVRRYKTDSCMNSFGILFERYSHLALGVCIKYLKHGEESQDAVMDIFVELLDKIQRSEIRMFKAWFYQVVKNHCLGRLRKRVETATEDFSGLQIPEDAPEHPGYDRELLRISLELISPEQKKCLELFYLEGMRYKEVAELTGFSEKEVKSHLQNGRRMLEKNMRKSA
ncbi:MAG: sigma-70 family RNA polymerase sigma factor [Bacteroidia bacterium]|nr:sigma-70 family RNA polymerase sigma factor [Bacteroidia bacterium]